MTQLVSKYKGVKRLYKSGELSSVANDEDTVEVQWPSVSRAAIYFETQTHLRESCCLHRHGRNNHTSRSWILSRETYDTQNKYLKERKKGSRRKQILDFGSLFSGKFKERTRAKLASCHYYTSVCAYISFVFIYLSILFHYLFNAWIPF